MKEVIEDTLKAVMEVNSAYEALHHTSEDLSVKAFKVHLLLNTIEGHLSAAIDNANYYKRLYEDLKNKEVSK